MKASIPAAIVLALGQAVAPAVLAQNPDCKDPQTQGEMTICANLDFQAADRELNAIYGKAVAATKEMDGGLPAALKGAEKVLREAQRAWIVFRGRSCELEGFEARGGSMESMLVGQCLADITRRRTEELKELAGGSAN